MKSFKGFLFLAAGGFFLACAAQADTHGPSLETALGRLPHSACLGLAKAQAQAGDLAVKAAQTHCRSEGFGWRASSVKDFGKLDCRACGNGAYACAYAEIALECRKAEPKLSWAGWFSDRP